MKSDTDFLVSVESLDDITFETPTGDPSDLLQTKHHRRSTGSVSDASSDLWKSLRIWFEIHARRQIHQNTRLYLITTGLAPDNSAAKRLSLHERDVSAARGSLDLVATTSTNQANRAAYDRYLATPQHQREAILSRVYVIDAAPTIIGLESELRQEVFWAAGKQFHNAFLTRLEGWWFRRVVRQLSDASQADRIGSIEIEAEMNELREQFKRDALPIDDDLLEWTLDEETAQLYGDYMFVRQLELVRIGTARIRYAIQDYYKAYTQRSRWVREDLVDKLDLHKYETKLVDEWGRVFEAMKDELGEAAADQAKEQAARAVLKWAADVVLPIRANVTEAFVSRGSFHMLSDTLRVGWHPDFKARLEHLLG